MKLNKFEVETFIKCVLSLRFETKRCCDKTLNMKTVAEYVVNPILWYIQQRMKQLNIDTLCKLVIQYYQSEEIKVAKDLLYNNFLEQARPKHLRKKVRQGENKLDNTIKDMVAVFHEFSVTNNFKPSLIVTATSNFPSLDIGNIDGAAMSMDICNIKQELAQLKHERESEKSSLVIIQQTLKDLKGLVSFQQEHSSPCSMSVESQQNHMTNNPLLDSSVSTSSSYAAVVSQGQCASVAFNSAHQDKFQSTGTGTSGVSGINKDEEWKTTKRQKPKPKHIS